MANQEREPFVLDFPNGQRVEDILKKADQLPTKAQLDQQLGSKATMSDVQRETQNLQNQINEIVRAPESGGDVAAEVAQARVGADGTNYDTLKERLDAEYEAQSEKLAITSNQISDVYDLDYAWESGSIATTGEEVPGDKNNFRSTYLNSKCLSGRQIVVSPDRVVAFAFYNGDTFVERTSFYRDTQVTIPDTTYNIRIVIANSVYDSAATLETVLTGITLPSIPTLNRLASDFETDHANLDVLTNTVQVLETQVFNGDYAWESGSIATTGEEVPGDKNNFRSTYLNPDGFSRNTFTVSSNRYLAIAFYNGDEFVSRTGFYYGTTVTIPDTDYNVRIVIANLVYDAEATLETVLSEISIPDYISLKTVSQKQTDMATQLTKLDIQVNGSDISIQFTEGLVTNTGQIQPGTTSKGNIMSQTIPELEYKQITLLTTGQGYISAVAYFKDGQFHHRSSWESGEVIIENEGYDVILLFANSSDGHTAAEVLEHSSVSLDDGSLATAVDAAVQKADNAHNGSVFLGKILASESGHRIIHFSVDDVWSCLYDIATHNYSSIFDNTFFNALKTLHTNYGICVTLNTFNTYSGTPAYDISTLPNTYQQEFQDNKDWLRFAFHAESDTSNYDSSSGISESYDKFVAAIYNLTGDYDCIDRITRLGYFGGTLENVLTIKNKPYGIIGLLAADSVDRHSYYLDSASDAIVQHKGKYFDLDNELIFIKTITRTLSQASAEIEANIMYQKYVEIFCHEYEASAPASFTSLAQYGQQHGYTNAFPSDLFI